MSQHYDGIAFTDTVRAVQQRYGSRTFYERRQARALGGRATGGDALTQDEQDYLAERDSFYLATVSETGWPYVQFRGGPPGFLRVTDEHTVGWADYRGNLQYVSTGNLVHDNRVAIIAMDYPNQQRLKIYGRTSIVYQEDDPDLVAELAQPEYGAVVQRAVIVTVEAYDWNCHQHITPRYTAAELEPGLADMRQRIEDLQKENAELAARTRLFATTPPERKKKS